MDQPSCEHHCKRIPHPHGIIKLVAVSLLLAYSTMAQAEWQKSGRGQMDLLHGFAEDNIATRYADTAHFYGEGSLSNERHSLYAAIDVGSYRFTPEKSGVAVKEAYWRWLGDNIDLTVGRQIIPWGKADGVTVTDRISPKDRREWIATEYQDTRLGVDAVKLRYLRDQSTLEAIWTVHPRFDAEPQDAANPLSALYRPRQHTLDGTTFTLDYPRGDKPRGIDAGEFAIRYSQYGSNMDLSLSYFNGWDRQIARRMERHGQHISMQPDYRRISQLGAEIAIPEGERVWRGEFAYLRGRAFADLQGGLGEHQQWLGLLGVDWQLGSWLVTAQYYADYVSNAAYLPRDSLQSAFTLSVDKKFLRDKLGVSASTYLDLNRLSSAWSLELDYALNDHFSLALGANHFSAGGNKNSTFAPMQALSALWLRTRYQF